jgi:hypothetical protein
MNAAQGALMARAKNIILQPRSEWPVIDGESATVQSLYMGYIIPLAAIGPLASTIGVVLFGVPIPFAGTLHVPLVQAITSGIVRYVLALAMVYVLAMIVDALAPTFGGTKNMVQALKVCAYASTAGWLAGIFTIIPLLGILGLLGLYSLYLIYLGLPVLMKVPEDKALGYTITVIVCTIVLLLIVGVLAARLAGYSSAMPTGT